jgi:hypothetical protein
MIPLAPGKNLVSVNRMSLRHSRHRRTSAQCLFNDSSFLFDRSPPPFYVTNRLNRPLLGSVHLFLVDTYRCAHIGQHPYLLTLSLDGSYQTLTGQVAQPEPQRHAVANVNNQAMKLLVGKMDVAGLSAKTIVNYTG